MIVPIEIQNDWNTCQLSGTSGERCNQRQKMIHKPEQNHEINRNSIHTGTLQNKSSSPVSEQLAYRERNTNGPPGKGGLFS